MNIVYNGGHTVTIILDNSTTAMTGHNEHPGSGRTLEGESAPAVNYEALVHSIGVKFAVTVDPYDVDLFRKTVKKALKFEGPSVIIARRPCILLPSVRGAIKPKVSLDPEKCNCCGACFRIGCPAIGQDEQTGKCRINLLFCTGCGLCTTTCPCEALEL